MDTQIQRLAQAIQALFHGKDATLRGEADRWISRFQTQPEAWAAADAILRNSVQSSPEMHFIAAQTLNQKVRFDLKDQLGVAERQALRDALFGHLTRSCQMTNSGALCTQLCLAIAGLALEMDEWHDIFGDLEKHFNKPETRTVLLELLQVIPEEFGNNRTNLSIQREDHFRNEMNKVSSRIMELILQCAQSAAGNAEMQVGVLQCLAAWVEFGNIPPEFLASSNLLTGCFQAMHDPQLFDAAVGFIIEVFHKYPGNDLVRSPGDLHVIQKVVPHVFSMKEWYLKSVQDDDLDTSKGICRVFSHMAEAYSALLLGEQEMQQEQVLSLLLTCTPHPDFEIAEKTFYFWEALLLGLEKMESGPLLERHIRQFKDSIAELVKILLVRLKYPEDFDESPADTREDFMNHRDFAAFLLTKCLNVLEPNVVLHLVFTMLEQGFEELKRNPSRWQVTEAALKAARSLAKDVASTSRPGSMSSAIILNILNINSQLKDPVLRTRLRGMSLTVVSAYSSWCKANNADLKSYLEHIMSGFNDPKTSSDAVYALGEFCRNCHFEMKSMGVFEVLDAPVLATLSNDDFNDLIAALCFVLNTLPADQKLLMFQRMALRSLRVLDEVLPVAKQVQNCMQKGESGSQVPRPPGPVVAHHLGVLRTLAKYTNFKSTEFEVNPTINLYQSRCWDIVQSVTLVYGTEPAVMDPMVSYLKHTVSASPRQFAGMMQPTMELILSGYRNAPIAPFLYAGRVLISNFGRAERWIPALLDMFRSLVEITFTVLNSVEQLAEHPDLVEDFFELAHKCTRQLPKQITGLPIFAEIFRCACVSITFDHEYANQAALDFLETALWVGIESSMPLKGQIDQVWNQHGGLLVESVILGIAGNLSKYMVRSLSALLYVALKYSHEAVEMVRHALQRNSGGHINKELEQFLTQNIGPEFDAGRQGFDDLLFDFSDRARLRQKRCVRLAATPGA